MAASGEAKQRIDLDIVCEIREGSVRRMHVSDIPAEERWANLKSQGEGKRFHSHPNPEAELPQFPDGTPRRNLDSLDRLSPDIKDRERPAGGSVFPNRAPSPTSLTTAMFSLPGA